MDTILESEINIQLKSKKNIGNSVDNETSIFTWEDQNKSLVDAMRIERYATIFCFMSNFSCCIIQFIGKSHSYIYAKNQRHCNAKNARRIKALNLQYTNTAWYYASWEGCFSRFFD